MTSSIREAIRRNTAEGNNMSNSFSGNLYTMDEAGYLRAEFEEESASSPQDNVCLKRLSGISTFIFSENHSLALTSLFLLLTVAESKDLDCLMLPIIGFNGMHEVDENFFLRFTDQILNALLKVLASKAPISVLINWHTAWFLQKLLTVRGKRLDDHNLQLFSTS